MRPFPTEAELSWIEKNGIYRPIGSQAALRAEYRIKRNLQHLTKEQLRQRFIDIFLNLFTLRHDGKLAFPAPGEDAGFWIRLFVHVLEEHVLRFGPYPKGFEDGFAQNLDLLKFVGPIGARANKAVAHASHLGASSLLKYGQADHLKAMLETGRIRIAPASCYSDPSLNRAIRDDELQLDFFLPPSEFKLEAFDHKTGRSKGPLQLVGNRFSVTSTSDYYVYCLSAALDPRLFVDFSSDACLVVKDPKGFSGRLVSALKAEFPNWAVGLEQVKYVDPVSANPIEIQLFKTKHFRYAYQKEFRFVCLPPEPIEQLRLRFIELGNLQDCCELLLI
jgi:hypothetical protein